MLGKTHFVFGCLTFAALGPATCELVGHPIHPGQVLLGIGLAGVAGLLPDIDHPQAFLTKGKVPLPRWVPFKYLLGQFLSIPPRLIGAPVRGIMGHRQGTHSIPFMLFWTIAALPLYMLTVMGILWLLTIPAGLLGMNIDLAHAGSSIFAWMLTAMPVAMVIVFLGYLSHLVSDSLNTAPIKWLWPISNRGIFFLPKPLRIRVSSPRELMFRAATIFLLLVTIVLNVLSPAAQGIDDGKGISESLFGKKVQLDKIGDDAPSDRPEPNPPGSDLDPDPTN